MNSSASAPAHLFLEGPQTSPQSYLLQPGLNQIGRRIDLAQSAAPDELLIDTDDVLIHRRYHCQIEVRPHPDSGFVYVLSGYPGATNPTYLARNNQQPLHLLDEIFLQPDTPFYIGTTAVRLRL